MVIETIIRQKEEAVSRKEYMSVQETANRGKLKAFRLTSRVTRICRMDIEALLNTSLYVRKSKAQSSTVDENGEPITEFYTTKEIIEKFSVSNS